MNAPDKLRDGDVRERVAQALPEADYRDQRVLLIVPDSTRTAPVGMMFKKGASSRLAAACACAARGSAPGAVQQSSAPKRSPSVTLHCRRP